MYISYDKQKSGIEEILFILTQ